MTPSTLFGIALAPLFAAIAQVESDNGKTSANVYQIQRCYVDDVNRLYPQMRFGYSDVNDREKSELMMFLYWKHWAHEYSRRTGNPITEQVLARIHNGGYNGMSMYSTKRYWRKVNSVMCSK